MDTSASKLTKVMVLPALLLLAAVFYYPLANIIGLSVDFPSISGTYYDEFLTNETMLIVTRRTFIYAALITAICFVLGYPLAVFLSRMVKEGRNFVLVCVLLPYLTSLLVRTYAWMILLSDNGVINQVLMALGLTDKPLFLLYSTFGAMIGMVHLMLPVMVLPIFAVVHGMHPEQMRAARALGGGPVRSFLEVFLPQTLAGVKAGCILVFAISLGFYITPAALGGTKDLLLSNIIAKLIENALDFRYPSAIAMILLAFTAGAYIVFGGGLATMSKGDNQASSSRKGRSLGALIGRLMKAIGNAGPLVRFQQWLWARNMGRSVRQSFLPHLMWYVFGVLLLLFLVLPSVMVVIMSFNGDDALGFPPTSWSLRWYAKFFSSQTMMDASVNSIVIAISVTLLSLVLGTMAAYTLVRGKLRGSQILYAALLAPIIVPSVVIAVGMYKVFADWGIIGSILGVLLAHLPGSLAFVVIIMSGTFMGLDRKLEMASASLGASRLRTTIRVVIPLVAPGLLAAGIFSFIHSFDEVVITSFVAGVNLQTLPKQIWLIIQNQMDPQIAAISTLVMILPIIALPFAHRR